MLLTGSFGFSYSKIFQLRFEQIPGKYWADDVTLFAVYDQKAQDEAGELGQKDPSAFKIGYFYLGRVLDLFFFYGMRWSW
jgi:hypothetical protein